MKKTYFIKTFNLILNLFILVGFESLSIVAFKWLLFLFDKNNTLSKAGLTQQIKEWMIQILQCSEMLATATLILLFLLLGIELLSRLREDTFLNYFKSVFQTFKLRHFLVQSEHSEKTAENQKVTTFNPIFKDFNKAVHKGVIDISKENIILYLKVPHTQQAQKLLKEMEAQIKEEVASRNPDYYFSAPNRVKNKMWLVGTKR